MQQLGLHICLSLVQVECIAPTAVSVQDLMDGDVDDQDDWM